MGKCHSAQRECPTPLPFQVSHPEGMVFAIEKKISSEYLERRSRASISEVVIADNTEDTNDNQD